MKRYIYSFILLSFFFAPLAHANEEIRVWCFQPEIRVCAGYAWYGMREFNSEMRNEGNNEIKGGYQLGFEASPGYFPFAYFRPTFGIEYLNANSKTTHSGPGYNVVVEWELPVMGLYFAPDLNYAVGSGFTLCLRPLSIGYYNLGWLDAQLSINDRPGSLEASGDAIGLAAGIGINYSFGGTSMGPKLFLLTGYRWLNFSNVKLNPRDGFTESAGGVLVEPGSLTEDLDYSGFYLSGGIGIRF